MGNLWRNQRKYFVIVFLFEIGFLFGSLGCPKTPYEDQAGLELRDQPASASEVLGSRRVPSYPTKFSFKDLFMYMSGLSKFCLKGIRSHYRWL